MQYIGLSLAAPVVINDATNLWYNAPQIQHYVGEHDRTYFTSVSAEGKASIQYLDNRDGTRSQPVLIKSWPRPDDHSSAALLVIPKGPQRGKILLVYSLHTSTLYGKLSKSPESIEDWGEEFVIHQSATYPQLFFTSDNKIICFFRDSTISQGDISFAEINQDMDLASLQTRKLILAPKNKTVYYIAEQHGNIIGIAWDYFDQITKTHQSVFYAQSDTRRILWKDIHGKFVADLSKMTPIYTAKEGQVRVWDVAFTAESKPVLGLVEFDVEGAVGEVDCCDKSTYLSRAKIIANGSVEDLGDIAMRYYSSGLFIDRTHSDLVYLIRRNDELDRYSRSAQLSCLLSLDAKFLARPRTSEDALDQLFLLSMDRYVSYTEYRTKTLILNQNDLGNCH
ncbi:BNR-4 repeat-containing protein [Deinococcus alpinitundrae]|uniref:BNR-4 repeat-containing protein n=1 Tax=Deinococcus alpinitundrae TaxID=468913 RepID=UPI00137AD5CD|nr:BNR-4 repeat-containing protein [Deinococcus alpinitundrae]